MTVKGRTPRKPKRCAARTHHMSVTQPIMAMGMAMPGTMPAVRDSFRMMTVNGTPTTNDHANMRSVSCSCQVGSSRQPSPVCAHTSTHVGAEDLRVSFPPAACCRRGLLKWLGCSPWQRSRVNSALKLFWCQVQGYRNAHTQSSVRLRHPALSQVLARLCSCKHDVAASRLSSEDRYAAATAPTTTALKLAILCYALCTTTAILQGNARAHKETWSCSSQSHLWQ